MKPMETSIEALAKEIGLDEAQNTFDVFREKYAWKNADLADALEVSRRSVQRYSNGDSNPTRKVMKKIADLRDLSILLDEVFVDREAAVRWLNTSVPVLKGRRPVDLIRRGELDQVISALASVYSGAFL
jgi:DNA-binding XRE family transcriptional regulator